MDGIARLSPAVRSGLLVLRLAPALPTLGDGGCVNHS